MQPPSLVAVAGEAGAQGTVGTPGLQACLRIFQRMVSLGYVLMPDTLLFSFWLSSKISDQTVSCALVYYVSCAGSRGRVSSGRRFVLFVFV